MRRLLVAAALLAASCGGTGITTPTAATPAPVLQAQVLRAAGSFASLPQSFSVTVAEPTVHFGPLSLTVQAQYGNLGTPAGFLAARGADGSQLTIEGIEWRLESNTGVASGMLRS